MKHFLVVKNSEKDINNELTDTIVDVIKQAGGSTQVVTRSLSSMREPLVVSEKCECVMVLGGDGSMLRTVRAVYPCEIPIVGVNLGNLGFLTQTEPEGVEHLLKRLISDQVRIEQRMMLEGTIINREASTVQKDIALNDIVVGRTGLSRIIRFRILINGELLNVYDADGVVISTPTGSTAYNLSAGGPVVCPKTNVIIVTPISPHSLFARSVVLSDQDTLSIEIEKVRSIPEEAVATFDGQTGRSMRPGDVIEIKRSDYSANLVRTLDNNFYEVLRRKMR